MLGTQQAELPAPAQGNAEQRSQVQPFLGHRFFILVIRHLHAQGIYKASAGTGGVRQSGAIGASFRRGQGSQTGGRGCSLSSECIYLTWEKLLPRALRVIWRKFVSQILRQRCPHHWLGLFARNAVVLREHIPGTHSTGPTISYHGKKPDFKLLYWRKQVTPVLDTRSQLPNAF